MGYSFKLFLYSVYVLLSSVVPVYIWGAVIDIFIAGNIEGRLLVMLIGLIVLGILTTILGIFLLFHFVYCVVLSYVILYGKHKLFCDKLDDIEKEAQWFIGKSCCDAMTISDKVKVEKQGRFLSKTLFEDYKLDCCDCLAPRNVNNYVDNCLKSGRDPVFVINLGRCYFLDEMKEKPASNGLIRVFSKYYSIRCDLDSEGNIYSAEVVSNNDNSGHYSDYELFNRVEAVRNSKSLNYKFNWFEKHVEVNPFPAVFNSLFMVASILLLVFK